MRKIDEIMNQYYSISYSFLIDMLLFSNDIDSDLKQAKQLITNQVFVDAFQNMLVRIRQNNYYPEETFQNAIKLLDYIEENSDDLNLDNCYKELENMVFFSDDKYCSEFGIKKNSLKQYKDSEYYIWKKDEIKKSIRFDYSVLISLSAPEETYFMNYFPSYFLNKNYVYALKKIIYVCPDIFQIEKFRNRALEVINNNLKLLEEPDMEIIQTYVTQNYYLDMAEMYIDINELEEFREENKIVLHELEHLDFYPFDFEEFKTYYELLKLEHYLYFEDPIDIASISLDTIYKFIEENNQDSVINNKSKLLDILNSKKSFADSRQEYNHYLVMLNELEEVDELALISNQFVKRCNNLDYIKGILQSIFKHDFSLYQQLYHSQKYDLGNFEAYLISDEDFEKIKDYLKTTDYPISIKLFLKECPSMFMDSTVYNRTMEILKSYDDNYSKQMIKN